MQLKALLDQDLRQTTEILAVSVDGPEDTQKMVDRISEEDGVLPEFPLLSDLEHQVIDRYGLFNVDDPRGREIAHPATYVIDREGFVRWKFVEVDYKTRPTNEDVFNVLAGLR